MKARLIRCAVVTAATLSLMTVSGWAQTSTLYLNSQPGDYMGGGQTVTYTDLDGSFSAWGGAQTIQISFNTPAYEHWWDLDFATTQGASLVPGMYEAATRWPFQSPTHPGLAVSGDGAGCNTLTGRFVVLEASSDDSGNVLSFAADFEQHCEGVAPALYGAIRFNSNRPVVPLLSVGDSAVIEGRSEAPMEFTISLSQPAVDTVIVDFATTDGTAVDGVDYVATAGTVTFAPGETSHEVTIPTLNDQAAAGQKYFYVNLGTATGAAVAFGQAKGTIIDGDGPQTFLILDSLPGDYIGPGQLQKLTVIDGAFQVAPTSGHEVLVHFSSDTWWDLSFAAPGNAVLRPRTYRRAERWPFQSPSHPGLDVSGDGRGCNMLTGRFIVHEAVRDDSGNVLSFAADFEQHCEVPQAPALYGVIRFNSSVPVEPFFERAGRFEFSAAKYRVSETAGSARIRVRRINGVGAATVDFSTVEGTGSTPPTSAGYTPTSGTLTFGPNQTVATFEIPITSDGIDNGNEIVPLRLSNPRPALRGAKLGPRSTAILTIVDKDREGTSQFGSTRFTTDAPTETDAPR